MFKKIRNIKKIAIISTSVLLVFGIGSLIFLMVYTVRIDNKLDEINGRINETNMLIQN